MVNMKEKPFREEIDCKYCMFKDICRNFKRMSKQYYRLK